MLNSNKPIKVVHLQKLANQWMLNDALVTEMAKQLLQWQHEKQTLVVWESKECSNRKKKWDMSSKKYISTTFQ